MDDLSPLVVEGLMLELIGEASRQFLRLSRPDPHWLQQARDLIHQQFHDGLTLSLIARSVGVHHTHLAREFRRRYRCTVGEYVRRLRVEFACRQLSSSDMPLSEIAQAAGFVDQSHFTRTFKIRTGMSPARYRSTFHDR
jgi:AraC family transcriptional regulator